MEASATPEKAEGPADRLGAAAPGSGHLTHMPSHIYVLTGRYEDAVDVNLRGAELDEAYLDAWCWLAAAAAEEHRLAPHPEFWALHPTAESGLPSQSRV